MGFEAWQTAFKLLRMWITQAQRKLKLKDLRGPRGARPPLTVVHARLFGQW